MMRLKFIVTFRNAGTMELWNYEILELRYQASAQRIISYATTKGYTTYKENDFPLQW